ncbi:MAG TPA: hypothetical protein DCG75_02595 [Bacteroidales bacterium]|nr:hypothetical protein [Bacteroidales bacterium]
MKTIKDNFILILGTLGCIITIEAHSQNINLDVNLDTFRFVQRKLYQYYDEKPYTGLLIRNFDNGKKQFEISYVDGIPVGSYTEWYKDGNIKVIGHYNEKGIEDGEFKKLYENGQIEYIGYIDNGDYDSLWLSYYKNGVIAKESYYNKGKRDSIWKFWTDKGELYYIEKYRNDTLTYKEQLMDFYPIEQ